MKKLHVLSYDLIITGQFDDSKRIVITIGDVQDHEAAVMAADITKFILNRDYHLSKSRELEDPEDNGEASAGAAMLREDC